jgi:hypothetical protein
VTSSTGSPPGWWTALGRDAAVLAAAAVTALPRDTTTETAEIARRRKLVRKALADARVSLWTSDEHGFDAARTLPRTIHVAELSR